MSDHAAALQPARQPHPMIHAGKWLLGDLLSTLTFVALYAATGSIAVATSCAIALGLGQIAYLKLRGAGIDLMQWLGLFLVVAFGGATLLTRNPVFVMLKPTLIYVAIGTVMLRPGWLNRYAPPVACARAGDLLKMFGYIWAALFFATAAANLALAAYLGPAAWAWFIGVFPITSKLVLVAVQYAVIRRTIRRRVRAGAAALAG